METTYEIIMAKRREEHEARMREIQIKEAELQKQKNALKAEFKAGNRALNQLCNHPTAKSIAAHRKQNAYNIKRFIGGKFSEWKTAWLDMENAGIGFEMKEDCIQFGITIPYKDPRVQQTEDEEQA